jgi:hypothetical protein
VARGFGFGGGVFDFGCDLGMDVGVAAAVVVVMGCSVVVVKDSRKSGAGMFGGALLLALATMAFLVLDFSGLLVSLPVVFSATFRACLALELDLYSV